MLFFKGLVLEQLEQSSKAIHCYLKSLQITSNDESKLQNISLYLVHLLGKEITLPIFKDLLNYDSNDVIAHHGMKILSDSIYDY